MSKVVIIKYNAGNVMSVIYAFERIGVSCVLSDDPEVIKSADRIIFPGVGEASTAMKSIIEKGLDKIIPTLKQPFLGTCVGMQLLCNHSEEGNVDCLGIFDVNVIKFLKKPGFKIPQTGWNNIFDLKSELTQGVKEQSYVYYNHGFYAPICEHTVGTTDHILPYSGMLQKDNFYACQFHSEISGDVGEQIFRNFLAVNS
jgi:glutamine amidotransferase